MGRRRLVAPVGGMLAVLSQLVALPLAEAHPSAHPVSVSDVPGARTRPVPVPMPSAQPVRPGPVPMPSAQPVQPGPVPMPTFAAPSEPLTPPPPAPVRVDASDVADGPG